MKRLNKKRRRIATPTLSARNDGQQGIKGFTLVELVITIAIVIILSVVSAPIYQGYTRKAKMSEGYALLGLIFSAQKNYYSEYGSFLPDNKSCAYGADSTCNETVLGIDARGNKYFTCFCVTSDLSGNDYSYHFLSYVLIPENLRENEKRYLFLYYNLTAGSNIYLG